MQSRKERKKESVVVYVKKKEKHISKTIPKKVKATNTKSNKTIKKTKEITTNTPSRKVGNC